MARTAPAVGFDTLSYARCLKDAGVDEAHAEAVRDAITQGVASKVDLDKGLAALKADIARIEDKMDGMATKADVANLETRMVRFVFAVAAGQVALIVGLLKLLP